MKSGGFSLLELIGVMAVLGILAGALAPSVIQMIDEGYATAEEQTLQTLATAWERATLDTKRVTSASAADWSSAIADYAHLPLSRITENDRGYARRLYLDPEFLTAGASGFGGFTQSQGLTDRPHSPRAVFASSLEGNLPASLPNATEFAAVWAQSAGTSIVEGHRIKIARVHLGRHFHRIVLSNQNTAIAGYQLEGGPEGAIPAGGAIDGTLTRYVIHNTKVGLNAPPYPSGNITWTTIVNDAFAARYQTDGTNWFWEAS